MANSLNLGLLSATLIVMSVNSGFAEAAAKSVDCLAKGNPICRKILKLSPRLDHREAYQLSNHFHRVAKKYGLPVNLLLAIAFQESRLRTDVIRQTSGLIFDEEKGQYKEVRIGSDFCMMQIHLSNIKKMKLDVKKLLSDTSYCLENGAKILSRYKKEHGEKDEHWWTYYNASHEAKRRIYLNYVKRHLAKLDSGEKAEENGEKPPEVSSL